MRLPPSWRLVGRVRARLFGRARARIVCRGREALESLGGRARASSAPQPAAVVLVGRGGAPDRYAVHPFRSGALLPIGCIAPHQVRCCWRGARVCLGSRSGRGCARVAGVRFRGSCGNWCGRASSAPRPAAVVLVGRGSGECVRDRLARIRGVERLAVWCFGTGVRDPVVCDARSTVGHRDRAALLEAE